ncbi:uncharacterized protein LOC143987679 [Lithobates pipiens]
MGCSISCALFERFSSFVEWVVRDVAGVNSAIHYLDDFLCVGPASSALCAVLLTTLEWVAEVFGIPLAPEKTERPTTVISFLGIVLDSEAMECLLPEDKLEALKGEVRGLVGMRKVQLRTLQSVLGKLNFACRIIPMGRVFSRRLAASTGGAVSPKHFVRLSRDHRADLQVWHVFLDSFNGRALWMAGPRNLEEGLSISRMGKKLAGLAFWFKLRGEVDYTKDFWVRQVMRGYRRGRQVKDTRRPVSFDLLGRLCDRLGLVCFSVYERILFKAAFVLAFFGAFRIGELVSPSRKGQGGLFFEDVVCGDDRVCTRIRRSKTDQGGKGKKVVVFAIPGSGLCPVLVLREFLYVRPACPGPLLVHVNGEFVSRFQFVWVFRKCLRALGLGGEKFSSHSFRIGAATEAARWGLDEAAVKRIGRWESRRFKSYVRPELVGV